MKKKLLFGSLLILGICILGAVSVTACEEPNILEVTNILREFLFERVYKPSLSNKETTQAREIIHLLYGYFLENDERLPEEYLRRSGNIDRKVTDYIAGMTDHYAIRTAEEIYSHKQ